MKCLRALNIELQKQLMQVKSLTAMGAVGSTKPIVLKTSMEMPVQCVDVSLVFTTNVIVALKLLNHL